MGEISDLYEAGAIWEIGDMSEDSMWSWYEVDYLLDMEDEEERREKWEAEQKELRKEVPEWLQEEINAAAKRYGTGVSYWKKYGRFRVYFGTHGWADVRKMIEERYAPAEMTGDA